MPMAKQFNRLEYAATTPRQSRLDRLGRKPGGLRSHDELRDSLWRGSCCETSGRALGDSCPSQLSLFCPGFSSFSSPSPTEKLPGLDAGEFLSGCAAPSPSSPQRRSQRTLARRYPQIAYSRARPSKISASQPSVGCDARPAAFVGCIAPFDSRNCPRLDNWSAPRGRTHRGPTGLATPHRCRVSCRCLPGVLKLLERVAEPKSFQASDAGIPQRLNFLRHDHLRGRHDDMRSTVPVLPFTDSIFAFSDGSIAGCRGAARGAA